jgi:hypothetical protein
MSIRALYTAAIVLILCQNAFSQDHFVIKGKILDKTSGVPIGDVNIKLEDFPVGTTTSKEGLFSISLEELPVRFIISHIGYQTKIIEITDVFEQEISISLERKTEELDEVVISGTKVETIYKDEVYSVLDYEFLDDDILLLIYRNSFSKELILLDPSNDTITKLNTVKIKPLKLFKDCFNAVHVLGKDSAYQLYFHNGRIDLIYPTPVSEFKKLMFPCVTQLNDNIYFKLNFYNELVVEYQYAKEMESQLHFLRRIVDSVKIDLINSNPYMRSLLNIGLYNDAEERILNMSDYVAMDDQIKMMNDLRAGEFEAHYLRKIVLTPVFAPLLKLRDTLVIFNHPQGQIEFYSPNNRLIRTVKINYADDPDWVKEIIADEITSNVYCLFLKSGVYNIRRVNTQNGQIEQILRIYYPFVKKIKVRDGYVFYLYKGMGEGENSKLFRQKMN